MASMVLATFSSRMEADVAVAKLAAHGIDAWVVTDSANGFEPQWDFIRGVRVVADLQDAADAAEVLGVAPPPPPEPLSPEKERIVVVVRNLIFGAAAVGIAFAVWEMFG